MFPPSLHSLGNNVLLVILSFSILAVLAKNGNGTANPRLQSTTWPSTTSRTSLHFPKPITLTSFTTSNKNPKKGCLKNCANKNNNGAPPPDEKLSHIYPMRKHRGKLRTTGNSFSRHLKNSSKECQSKSQTFYCNRIKFYTWMARAIQQKSTPINTYIELIKREGQKSDTDLEPVLDHQTSWLDSLFNKWGQLADKQAFRTLKKYLSTSELKLSLPFKGTYIALAPNTHQQSSGESARIFFDPGFNLKMKLPFFRDELKFAVSTGPSFIAGLGVGMVVLGMKTLLSPLMFGMKAMILSFFMRDMSPFDFLRVFGFGGSEDENTEAQHQVDVYNPPPVNNHYENMMDKNAGQQHMMQPSGPSNLMGPPSGPGPDPHVGGYSNQVPILQGLGARVNPILPYLVQALPSGLTSPSALSGLKSQASSFAQTWLTGAGGLSNLANLVQDANGRKHNNYRPLLTGPGPAPVNHGGGGYPKSGIPESGKKPEESGFKYVPSAALQLEVENYDPFYSPLLSRIDSIFMHLGFTEEGCKERAVCSIYKSPVKYAPYSNLLSAQLSKHQSELKRPVSTSPKILRYFKYMKAAKDGQGALNCIELYPKCTNDTEKLTNLPMVKTFQQLTDLMSSGPGNTGG